MITINDLDWYCYGNGEGVEYNNVEFAYFYRNDCYFVLEILDDITFEHILDSAGTDYDAKQYIVDLINEEYLE